VKITRFEDLKVWQLAHKLSLDVAKLVKDFPKDEKYDLSDQMRRSARSIPSDISEGFGRYHYNDKLTFYERGRSSLGELRNHFKEALGNGYVVRTTYDKFTKNMNEVGFLLSKMMKNIRTARDFHEAERKSKRPSSRRTSNAQH
jgi:four helix bundle protein